jgi:hypothetical protein
MRSNTLKAILCGCVFFGCTPTGGQSDVANDVHTTATGAIVINEVSRGGATGDWVEVLNTDDHPVNLGGWTLTDSDPEHAYIFPDDTVLASGGFLVVFKSETHGFTFGLGGEDQVQLYDSEGAAVDSVSWTSKQVASDTTYGRMPDGTGGFVVLYDATPGGPNASTPPECGNGEIEFGEICDGENLDKDTCVTLGFSGGNLVCSADCMVIDMGGCTLYQSTVLINEVTSADTDQIELYNNGPEDVDMTGWILADKRGKSSKDAYTIPQGTVLAADSFVVFEKSKHFAFGLGGDDAVMLYNTLGLVDVADYAKDEAVVSFCRKPDGTGDFAVCSEATFGESNK